MQTDPISQNNVPASTIQKECCGRSAKITAVVIFIFLAIGVTTILLHFAIGTKQIGFISGWNVTQFLVRIAVPAAAFLTLCVAGVVVAIGCCKKEKKEEVPVEATLEPEEVSALPVEVSGSSQRSAEEVVEEARGQIIASARELNNQTQALLDDSTGSSSPETGSPLNLDVSSFDDPILRDSPTRLGSSPSPPPAVPSPPSSAVAPPSPPPEIPSPPSAVVAPPSAEESYEVQEEKKRAPVSVAQQRAYAQVTSRALAKEFEQRVVNPEEEVVSARPRPPRSALSPQGSARRAHNHRVSWGGDIILRNRIRLHNDSF